MLSASPVANPSILFNLISTSAYLIEPSRLGRKTFMPNLCGCRAHLNFSLRGAPPLNSACVSNVNRKHSQRTHTQRQTDKRQTHTPTQARGTHTHMKRARAPTHPNSQTHTQTHKHDHALANINLQNASVENRTQFVPGCSHRTLPNLRQSSGFGCRCRGCTRKRSPHALGSV